MVFIVSGDSMKPAYPAGSCLLVNRLIYKFISPKVGDAIIARDPRDRDRLLLKRVMKKDENGFWLAGDNPSESTDSRIFGSVERDLIVGKVLFRYWGEKRDRLMWTMSIFAFLGLADSTYLTYNHFAHHKLLCSIVPGSCDLVTTSRFATIFGIPTALYGVVFYITAIILVFWYWQSNKFLILQYLSVWTIGGFMVSLFLVYLQVFVIGAYCLFCLISAAASTLLFISALLLIRQRGRI